MAHELVSGNPGNSLDAEGKGGMLQYRVVAERQYLFQKAPYVASGDAFPQIADRDGRITESRRKGDRLLRLGCMVDKSNQHENLSEKPTWSLSDLGNRSENSAGRGQVLSILQGNSCPIAQKSGKTCTVQTKLQQIYPKSYRLLGQANWGNR
jgi:hypothetical protein